MKLDISIYRSKNIEGLRKFAQKNSFMDQKTICQTYAMISGVPLIGVLTFWMEIFGKNDEIQSEINKLIKFYNIEEVIYARPEKK